MRRAQRAPGIDTRGDAPKVGIGRKRGNRVRLAHAFARDVLWGIAIVIALYELVLVLVR